MDIVAMLKNDHTYFDALPEDLKRLLVIKLLTDPQFAVIVGDQCAKKSPNSSENESLDINKLAINNLICNNRLLFEILWTKYISIKLPEKLNNEDFINLYSKVVKEYNKEANEIIKNVNNSEYEILVKTAKKTIKLWDQLVKKKDIAYDLVYPDIKYKGEALIFNAIYSDLYSSTEQLLENGANPNNRDEKQITPLMYACRKHNTDIIKLLFRYKANLFEVRDGKIAFMDVITNRYIGDNKNVEMANIFINEAKKQNRLAELVNWKDNNGNTTLMLLFEDTTYDKKIRMELLNLLLKNGADINEQNKQGDTALLLAIPANFYPYFSDKIYKTVKMLLENGADPNIRNNQGLNALEKAKLYTNRKIANLIKFGPKKEEATTKNNKIKNKFNNNNLKNFDDSYNDEYDNEFNSQFNNSLKIIPHNEYNYIKPISHHRITDMQWNIDYD